MNAFWIRPKISVGAWRGRPVSSSVHVSDRLAVPRSALASSLLSSLRSQQAGPGRFGRRVFPQGTCSVLLHHRAGLDSAAWVSVAAALASAVAVPLLFGLWFGACSGRREGVAAVGTGRCCGCPVFIPHAKGRRCCSRTCFPLSSLQTT